MAKRLAVAAASLLAAVYAVVAVYGADKITRVRRQSLGIAPDQIASNWEEVTFASRGDGVGLRGWWFPGDPSRRQALILVHGRGQNRYDKAWGSDVVARAFLAQGFGVLMFDLRSHGESAPARLGYGPPEAADVLGALDHVRRRGFADAEIAIIGISYGAAAMLLAGPQMPSVGALVADSAYAEIWPVIAAQIPIESPLLARLRPDPGIRLASRLLFGIDLGAARPIAALKGLSERGILFIHGAQDGYVPPHHSEQLFAASTHPASELWIVPGADHAQTVAVDPEAWFARVGAFIAAQMDARGGRPEPVRD